MTSVGIYSTNYFGYEPRRQQASPVTIITEDTHPIHPDDPRLAGISWWRPKLDAPTRNHGIPSDPFYGRACAVWWFHHPELALPNVDVTVSITGNFIMLVPDLAERCLAELGDDDVLLMRHPWRDDILDEAGASLANWKWNKQPVAAQAESYIAAGHPRHWGLFHGGFIVRRDTPAVRAFNAALETEYRRWSSQNQISLPYLIRTSGLKWHAWPDVAKWHSLPFAEKWLRYGPINE